ncbi:MAG: AtpZ/AtpI family protein [Planctomycetes bacterium]|nr:AtpZ/AtpI family protein [Planctomycetota bacterium]
MSDPLPPETGRPLPPSPEEYERLRRAQEALRESPQVKSDQQRQRRDANDGVMQKYLRYTGLGVQFLFTLGLPILGGWALDNWLGLLPKTPAFIIAGSLIGMAAAMWGVIRGVARMEKEEAGK